MYFVSVDLTQFLFQKFGFWWLIANRTHTDDYTVYLFKRRPKSLWYSGGGSIAGKRIMNKRGYCVQQRQNLFRLAVPRFTTTSPLEGDDESAWLENFFIDVKGKKMAYESLDPFSQYRRKGENYSYTKADAAWNLSFKSENVVGHRSEIPEGYGVFMELGEDKVAWSENRLQVERLYGGMLSMLPAFQNDFDLDEHMEEYGQSGWNVVWLKKEIKTGIMSESDYWNQYDNATYDDVQKGFSSHELTFPYPTLYQYKTQFGVLNHLAV